MEPGDGSGDNVPLWTPQQRGVCALQLQSGLHRLHLLHQSVGHPGLGQVHPNPDVSAEPSCPGWCLALAPSLRQISCDFASSKSLRTVSMRVPSGLPARLTWGTRVHPAPAAPSPSQQGRTRLTRSLSIPTGRFCTQPPGTRSESGTCGGQFQTAAGSGSSTERCCSAKILPCLVHNHEIV